MFFFNRHKIHPVHRKFEPSFLSDSVLQNNFEREGFVVLRNIIREEEIEDALTKFRAIQKKEGYEIKDRFESSGNFRSADLQKDIFNYIEDFMHKIAPRFANLHNCEIGKGGAFFIKPNTISSKLDPHQDSPVVDETKTYAVFAWIPLMDINEKNGALYVLPKSHLWGNSYRSQHIPWAFGSLCRKLWNHMQPVYINKGDVILFDPSIIHASEENKSEQYRIVLCGALLPKNHQKVEYVLNDKKTIEQYLIDDDYWLDGGNVNALKKYPKNILTNSFPNPVKENMISHLLKT